MAIFFGDLEDSGNMITLLDDFLPILRATDILFKVKLPFSLVQCPGERFLGMIFILWNKPPTARVILLLYNFSTDYPAVALSDWLTKCTASCSAQNKCAGFSSVETTESRREAALCPKISSSLLCDCWRKCWPFWVLGVSPGWFYKGDRVHFCWEKSVPGVILSGISFSYEDEY